MSILSVRAVYCPACGAPLDPGEATRMTCGYCGSVLEIQHRKITQTQRPEPELGGRETHPLPLADLISTQTGRFELSILEQVVPNTPPDGFFPLTLQGGRFALAFLRLVDEKDKTKFGDLDQLCEVSKESLSDEEDPGLAAYQALEHLSETPFVGRLEIAIMLFSPDRSMVTVYNAGCPGSVWWVSSEEGRGVDLFRAYPPLEKKMLRLANDHFSNSEPCYLAADDLIVAVSAAYVGRGGGSYSNGSGPLIQSLNSNLGEHPLRVVTLAKNSYWDSLPPAALEEPPSGTLRVAAVRALAPKPAQELSQNAKLESLEFANFEASFLLTGCEHLALHPLHDDRACYLLLKADDLHSAEIERMTQAVLGVLDRRDHGDNENPREAGRQALIQIDRPCSILVLQVIPKYGRVKWFRAGWPQPICLGPRGLADSDFAQKFDEGGEASTAVRSRLFFPGDLPFEGPVAGTKAVGEIWHGGKASALYGALFAHWRTSNTSKALKKFLLAAMGDVPGRLDLSGSVLLTRTRE